MNLTTTSTPRPKRDRPAADYFDGSTYRYSISTAERFRRSSLKDVSTSGYDPVLPHSRLGADKRRGGVGVQARPKVDPRSGLGLDAGSDRRSIVAPGTIAVRL